jgi:tetratricopeptide (TPR) repeat protein
LVMRRTQVTDGRVKYVSLPITLSFARHQLRDMGDFETECRRRHRSFSEAMELRESELFRYETLLDKFGIDSDTEKKAVILCERGKSEVFAGNLEKAELAFSEALSLAPQSAYVHAMVASYELARGAVGEAFEHIDEGLKRASDAKTKALCFTTKARIMDHERNHYGRVKALRSAVEYDPSDTVTRHQYGVALSRAGKPLEAIDEFTRIIEVEKERVPPRETLLMSLKTRIINLRRVGRLDDAARDLEWAEELLRKHRHLSPQARHFRELHESG